jgi:phosphate transport system permease protein
MAAPPTVAPQPAAPSPDARGVSPWLFIGDQIFHVLALGAALLVPLLVVLIVIFLFKASLPSIHQFGFGFFTSNEWDPVNLQFGALTFIYGTLVTSALAMLIAVPLGVGAAAYLSEIASGPVRRISAFLIELLAAIPSVVYGFWGLFFVVPLIQPLAEWFGASSTSGKGLFTSGLLLAIMVIPYITAIAYDVCRAVPRSQREGALALAATRWQMIWSVILPYARPGIIGGSFLALGRALGETMAVAMLIGNVVQPISDQLSLFSLGYSIPSAIAVQLPGVVREMHRAALIELGLALFLVTVVVNCLARVLISRLGPRRRPSLWRRLIGRRIAPAATGVVAAAIAEPVAPRVVLTAPTSAPSVADASPAKARAVNRFMTGVLAACLIVTLIPLFHIFGYVLIRGTVALNLAFFTNLPIQTPSGLGHSLIGSAIMVGLATLVAVPVGILGALYLSEFRTSRLAPMVRFIGELLAGVPSVIIGIFAYALLVLPFNSFSAYAGAFALGVMMIPIVMRSSEESLRLVPPALRNASYALGATHWQTVLRVIIPAALPAIITGVFLGIARIAGETAPLLFTAYNSNFWPDSLDDRTPFLTYYIYTYALSDQADEQKQAWAGALVLLVFVMAINVGIRLITGKRVLSASHAD